MTLNTVTTNWIAKPTLQQAALVLGLDPRSVTVEITVPEELARALTSSEIGYNLFRLTNIPIKVCLSDGETEVVFDIIRRAAKRP